MCIMRFPNIALSMKYNPIKKRVRMQINRGFMTLSPNTTSEIL